MTRSTAPQTTPPGPLRVAIIGTGAAAMAGAISLAEQGQTVNLIERGTTGGTCVNVGCVPSKILIRAADVAHTRRHSPFDLGIAALEPRIDRRALVVQQQSCVDALRASKYEAIIRGNARIRQIRGSARFLDARTLLVRRDGGEEERLSFDRALIATGASPAAPPIPGLAEAPYWTSTDALAATELPRHLLVLGGSAVGLEIGQAFRRLGAEVTVLELTDRLLPAEDDDIGRGLREALKAEGIAVETGFRTESVRYAEGRFELGGSGRTFAGDRLLVATGRRPNTADLALAAIGVRTLAGGAVEVDGRFETSVQGIYAAGDCTNHPQLVYVAAAAGARAAANLMGADATLDLSAVPSVIFTEPQVATVGLDERAAREQGIAVAARRLDLENVPRALVNFDTRGFIKLVADEGSGRLLGAQVLAAEAGEIIQVAVLAIRHRMTVRQFGEELFPYLVMAEGLKLCAQSFGKDVRQLSCCAA